MDFLQNYAYNPNMPELPEVQTTVNGLKRTVVGLTIKDVWTDLAKKQISRKDFLHTIKYLPFFEKFKKSILNQKITSAERRAKNILINLSNNQTILIHMKMTGHILYGEYVYDKKSNSWQVSPNEKNNALRDPYNRYIHVVFSLSNGKHFVFCDARKFGKVTLFATNEISSNIHTKHLGPEIFDKTFDFKKFKEAITKKATGKIKTVLMDQTVISGIGNIYSDEALWLASIHPKSIVKKIPQKDLENLFTSIKIVLKKGLDFGGDSTSDYRQIDGSPGKFNHEHNVYRLAKTKCRKTNCKGVIIREVIGGRSAHFCNKHQKVFK